jgi:putative transposase
MIKSFKVRLKPNNKQKSFLLANANVARFVYNWTLEQQQVNYKNGNKFLSNFDLRKKLTLLKKDELNWLYNYDVDIAKQAVKDACDSYITFFKKGYGFPKFKSKKHSKPSFFIDNLKIKIFANAIKIPKLDTKIKLSEVNYIPLNAKYSNPRITFDGVNWFLSVGVDVSNDKPELTNNILGIDVGLKDLAIRSDGITHQNINKSKKIKILRRKHNTLKKAISRKYEKNKIGSKFHKTQNIRKAELKSNRIYKKLENIQTDYFNKIAITIARTKPKKVVMEKLNIAGMRKNKHLSKSFQEASLYKFKSKIQNKCLEFGIEFIEANTFFPSSKLCSHCGVIKKDLKLKDRVFKCDACNIVIDRDFNASQNLKKYPELQGSLSLWSVKPKESSCKTKSDTMKKEKSKKLNNVAI